MDEWDNIPEYRTITTTRKVCEWVIRTIAKVLDTTIELSDGEGGWIKFHPDGSYSHCLTCSK